jgi:hypothetical protein
MEESQIYLILQYKMVKEEAFAFRLALLYLQLAKQYFPNYKHVNLPKNGDPRKCELFKYAWKLMQTTKGRLALEEYRSYMQAQFSVLKQIKVGNYHPLIHPRCLVGDQAWRRWLLWSKHFEEVKKVRTEEKTTNVPAIKEALHNTHFILQLRLKEITKERLEDAMASKYLFRLIDIGAVSMYFVAMSKTVQEYAKLKSIVLKDLASYQKQINPEIEVVYKKLFGGV